MIRLLVSILVFVMNTLYATRPIPRFYVLETVARVPYFAYLSVLHLYETVGFWRRADWLKVHFAESWNELHHLLIMESLGGNQRWSDRFLARHVALIYYWIIVVIYLVAPRAAYHFMELVEAHAYHTYDMFLLENGDRLKALPAPEIAVTYYRDGDLYMFDEFQTARTPEERRPVVNNLYDVFVNIRDDEMEHVKTMVACQKEDANLTFKSPHTLAQSAFDLDAELHLDDIQGIPASAD
ncbi:MAG: alternative oxidase [Elainellaceae cyanobacterium]